MDAQSHNPLAVDILQKSSLTSCEALWPSGKVFSSGLGPQGGGGYRERSQVQSLQGSHFCRYPASLGSSASIQGTDTLDLLLSSIQRCVSLKLTTSPIFRGGR
ncbi:hypothetical protein PCASD_03865 [Puccinia coronata f. sp. avenae]|uniref:Uncharacterized protein n=1 Tax=Puccinia coronata f. sp. avenae TaxID=200324 RepID=A0A2N5V2W3_9BASI|nr:hypothetical protein PCASD_03865 [Puccinia coronata f. sp. avenae]